MRLNALIGSANIAPLRSESWEIALDRTIKALQSKTAEIKLRSAG